MHIYLKSSNLNISTIFCLFIVRICDCNTTDTFGNFM